jgi:hypothetical protein
MNKLSEARFRELDYWIGVEVRSRSKKFSSGKQEDVYDEMKQMVWLHFLQNKIGIGERDLLFTEEGEPTDKFRRTIGNAARNAERWIRYDELPQVREEEEYAQKLADERVNSPVIKDRDEMIQGKKEKQRAEKRKSRKKGSFIRSKRTETYWDKDKTYLENFRPLLGEPQREVALAFMENLDLKRPANGWIEDTNACHRIEKPALAQKQYVMQQTGCTDDFYRETKALFKEELKHLNNKHSFLPNPSYVCTLQKENLKQEEKDQNKQNNNLKTGSEATSSTTRYGGQSWSFGGEKLKEKVKKDCAELKRSQWLKEFTSLDTVKEFLSLLKMRNGQRAFRCTVEMNDAGKQTLKIKSDSGCCQHLYTQYLFHTQTRRTKRFSWHCWACNKKQGGCYRSFPNSLEGFLLSLVGDLNLLIGLIKAAKRATNAKVKSLVG